jgi:hypothetical protein
MHCSNGSGLAVIVALALVGCSSHAEARPRPRVPVVEPAASSSQANLSPAVAGESSAASPSSQAPALGTEAPPPRPAPDPKTGEVPRGLPELKLVLSGLHIGGGPNDAVTKRPFIETLETGFDAMRVCYRQADEPDKGGTFGVDLRIDRSGGHPIVQSVRTAMKGDRFKACLERAFQGLEFGRPAKGPTVLSASVRFTLEH